MGVQEDYKLKLASYKNKDKIRRNMLIMIAKSKERDANEIIKAIEFYRFQPDYVDQINDLIINLIEKSNIYKDLFIKHNTVPQKTEQTHNLKSEDASIPTISTDTGKNKKVKINNKIKNSLNNVLEKIPFPPSYLLFELTDKNEYEKQNRLFFTIENENKRKKILKNFNQKNESFKQKISTYFPTKSIKQTNKPKKIELFETEVESNSIENILKKMFKPLICFYCGKRFEKNKEDEFKFNCHLKNHENENKELLSMEDYKNRKTREFFPQIKTFETRFKNVDLYLPSLDDFDFKDDKVFVENRESIFCNKCGKSVCLKKEGQKFLIIDAKKVGLNVFAHRQCLFLYSFLLFILFKFIFFILNKNIFSNFICFCFFSFLANCV